MRALNDGGPAYPVQWEFADGETGMTLRDWFAGQALVGLMTNPKFWELSTNLGDADTLAHMAYEIADDMVTAKTRFTAMEAARK